MHVYIYTCIHIYTHGYTSTHLQMWAIIYKYAIAEKCHPSLQKVETRAMVWHQRHHDFLILVGVLCHHVIKCNHLSSKNIPQNVNGDSCERRGWASEGRATRTNYWGANESVAIPHKSTTVLFGRPLCSVGRFIRLVIFLGFFSN